LPSAAEVDWKQASEYVNKHSSGQNKKLDEIGIYDNSWKANQIGTEAPNHMSDVLVLLVSSFG